MTFIKRMIMFLFLIVFVFTGLVLLLVAFSPFPGESWAAIINAVRGDIVYQIILSIIGLLYVLMGIIIPYRHRRHMKRNRVVAFQNPDGEVTISLSAIEEYIRKIGKSMSEIRDLRTGVDINRKGINISVDISIVSDSNIPDVTERMQTAVKGKIQGILGVEEKINMKIHVKKIAGQDGRGDGTLDKEPEEANIPYRNM